MPKSSPIEPDSEADVSPTTDDAEAKAAFHLRLRARGVRDLAVLRAFEVVPRAGFVSERHAGLAARDLPLPIACGQTSHEPWRSALAVEALGIEPGHRVLEIGSGSGYVTAILAQLAAEVLGVERWAGLADAAQARLATLGLTGVAVVWGDGLAMPPEAAPFDRILVHGTIGDEAAFDALLAAGGRLVAGMGGALVVRPERGPLRSFGECRLAPLLPGLAGHHARGAPPPHGSPFARPAS